MLLNKYLDEIIRLMKDNNLDVLILGPSGDLEYLTGLHPHQDERFKALFILSDKRYFYIAPELYYEETKACLGDSTPIFKWGDSEGFLKAIAAANEQFPLSGGTIGVNDGIIAIDMLDLSKRVTASYVKGNDIIAAIRLIKDDTECAHLRKASSIADKVAEDIVNYIHAGMTEKAIKNKIEELLYEYGGQELSFETIVASGPNSANPHYNDSSRTIEAQDVIVLDFGCRYNGFCSDISRTVFVGEPTEFQKKIYAIVLEANLMGEAAARQGVTAEAVDKAARDVIRNAGFGEYFVNRTGHGVGIAVHEAPYIKEGNDQILQNGMVFSVEPGIYLPGQFGMRVEDLVLIDNGSAEILNKANKTLVKV